MGTEKEVERAVLAGVGPEAPAGGGSLPMLDELAELVRTAGGVVVGRIWQRRAAVAPGTYLGKGKIDELKDLCEAQDANLVVVDTDLTPAQVRGLEDALDLRVIDRSELIIHIFASHARTLQSRLQVELAQLKYLSPRLKRMWTHLSRITGAGGIGSRGPGEKQIEVDRRIIQRRIRDLTRELEEIEARRERQVATREDCFKVSLAGYTNAGKSTLMNALTGAGVLAEDKLFATLDTRTRKWTVAPGQDCLLSDTVGFIQKLPHHLVASFHATLSEAREADLILHVVDAGDLDASKRVATVRSVLKQIGAGDIPELLVLNKIDLLPDRGEIAVMMRQLDAKVAVSALTGEGLDQLRDAVSDRMDSLYRVLELSIPASDGKALALLARVGRILNREYRGDWCRVTARVPVAAVSEFGRFEVPA